MAILVIDCGNSYAKFGLWQDEGGWINRFRLSNDRLRGATASHAIEGMLKEAEKSCITQIILASVVPDIEAILEQLLGNMFSCPLKIVTHENCGDMRVLTDTPAEVGADRLVNAYAAKHYFGGSKLVIDFGTATTIDVLDEDGNYIGGLILPGLELSLQTLHYATAKLPLVKITRAEKILGKNTKDAINQGIYWGYIAMLEGLCKKLQEELGSEMGVIATGSYADLLGQDCPFIESIDPELTLKGLVALAQNEKDNE